MYACKFGLSNQDVRMSLTKVSRPVTQWRELISPEINYAAIGAQPAVCKQSVAMPQQ